ncbi:MAG: hypothetical protein U5K75_10435 [Ahrensia sp.]|nr:hypothetical protein [Ahrensia sp.]
MASRSNEHDGGKNNLLAPTFRHGITARHLASRWRLGEQAEYGLERSVLPIFIVQFFRSFLAGF